MKEWLTFDDVQILPCYSEVESRRTVDVTTKITRNWKITTPLIAAPMDTVCGARMAVALTNHGAVGALHRFMSIEEQEAVVSHVVQECLKQKMYFPVIASIGAVGDYQERAEKSLEVGANILLIDVAHGDHIHVKRALEWLNKRSDRRNFDVIAGN